MDVSICIVNWNTRELLLRCLASIYGKTRGVSFEIIVVDNASSDGSVEAVKREFSSVVLIESSENLGFARGSNLAAEKSVGRQILYLNPDTELVTNAIGGMSKLLDEMPQIGAVGCRLLNSDGSIQYTCACNEPTPWNELCALLALDRLLPRVALFSARELTYWDHACSRDVQCLSGACLMLRRELVSALRGLDSELFMYGEDVDMCIRVAQTGLRVHYLASEVIYHHEGSGSRKRGQDFAPLRQREANHYVLKKHYGAFKGIRYRVAVLIGSTARCVGAALLAPATLVLRSASARSRISHVFRRYGRLALWALELERVK